MPAIVFLSIIFLWCLDVVQSVAIPQASVAESFLDTRYCAPGEVATLNQAWTDARSILSQLENSVDSPIYDLFFGGGETPGKERLRELFTDVSSLKPTGDGAIPQVVCATREIFERDYPDVPRDIVDSCLDPSSPTSFLTNSGRGSYHAIFTCAGKFFQIPAALPPPSPALCPAVQNNVFATEGEFQKSESMLLIFGLMKQYSGLKFVFSNHVFSLLNPAVKRRRFPDGISVAAYTYMSAYRCTNLPDISQPPWSRDGEICAASNGASGWNSNGASPLQTNSDGDGTPNLECASSELPQPGNKPDRPKPHAN